MLRMKSIPLKDLVQKLVIRGKDRITALTAFGRHVYLAVLLHILDSHDVGLSWDGLFGIEDVYILEYPDSLHCWIAKETSSEGKDEMDTKDGCTLEQRSLDIQQVDAVITVRYTDGATVPVYFHRLRGDLRKASATYLMENPWFITYLRFHVALMTSTARKFLINQLFELMCVYKLLSANHKKNKTSVFAQLVDWIENLFAHKDPLLLAVYKFENPFYEDESATEKKAAKHNIKKMAGKNNSASKEKEDIESLGSKNNVASEENEENLDQSLVNNNSSEPKKEDRYDESLGSALSYKRHLVSHFHHNIQNAHMIEDFDAIELFAASKVPHVLPDLIVHLLKANNMTKRFAKLWSAYCAMRSDKGA